MPLTDVDRTLIRRCLATEPGAWKDFVDRFAGLFVHVVQHTAHARSVTLSGDDVEDFCSDVFLAIIDQDMQVLKRFRGDSSLPTYLTVIARRVVVKAMAQRKQAEALGHVPAAHHEAFDAVAGAENGRIESRELVQHMLRGLPAVEAAVIEQFHLEGKSYREISSALGVPENSIGPTLTRAREKLRRNGQLTH